MYEPPKIDRKNGIVYFDCPEWADCEACTVNCAFSLYNEECWCARCKEQFEIAQEPARWRMGEMRKITKAPKWMRRKLEGETGKYLCGNCFFDMLDEKEAPR